MDVFLPKGFEAGLAKPRMRRPARASNLCVKAAGVYYPVLRRWASGFAVSAMDVPALEGVVDLYDGADHLHQCLITRCESAKGEHIFAIKRSAAVEYAAVTEHETQAQAVAPR
jgi:hypothetical protein